MQFNSTTFIIFLPVVVILYYLLKPKYRWALLLAASYYFYACWRVSYLLLIVSSTLVDYFASLIMARQQKTSRRRLFLFVSLFANLGLLGIFKYYGFATASIQSILQPFNIFVDFPNLDLLLPVGISFYTFQTLSYTIEVYQGKQKPEKHLGIFALYVSYFPQLVAGPIERFSTLGGQLKQEHRLLYENISQGFRLILYGLFIKMVIADNISPFVDQIYEAPLTFNSLQILTGIIFYSFQIYSDFYGYSLIAIGSAKLMGVNIMDNFRTPYLSKNIGEFWKRWHISLSTWFRDYLYIPMGGSRVVFPRWILNILVVFTVSGLWHGANWTFVLWGLVFGITYLVENLTRRALPSLFKESDNRLWNGLLYAKTFVIVTFAWILFRSENLAKLKDIFKGLYYNTAENTALNIPVYVWVFFILFIVSDILLYNKRFDSFMDNKPAFLRWTTYAILIYTIIVFAGLQNFPFIYFQF